MPKFAHRHFQTLDRITSFLGALGLGYIILRSVDARWQNAGIPIAFVLVFLMACGRVYLEHVASGESFWTWRWSRRK